MFSMGHRNGVVECVFFRVPLSGCFSPGPTPSPRYRRFFLGLSYKARHQGSARGFFPHPPLPNMGADGSAR
jgi:hypothetical protein